MRPIKFRIKRRPEFGSEWEVIDFRNIFDTDLYLSSDAYDKATLSQFTDLLDKNGKEIYEKDILRDHKDSLWRVLWNDQMACFELCNELNGCKDTSNHLHGSLGASYFRDIEVIGNIHQYPHLLTQQEDGYR